MTQRRVVDAVEAARDGIHLVRLHRIFDASTLDEFNQTLTQLIQRECYHLVVDLERVEFVSSAGWGALTSELGRLREQGGDLRIAAMAPEIHDVFLLLELDTFMDAYYSVEDAIRSFELDFDKNATATEDESAAETEPAVLETHTGQSAEETDAASDTAFPASVADDSEDLPAPDAWQWPDDDLAEISDSASEDGVVAADRESEYSAEQLSDEYLSQPNLPLDEAEEAASDTEILDSEEIVEYGSEQWSSSTDDGSPESDDTWASGVSESDSTGNAFDDNEYWAEVVTGKEVSNLRYPAEANREPELADPYYHDREDNSENGLEMTSLESYAADDSQFEETVCDEISEVTQEGAPGDEVALRAHHESDDETSYQPDGTPQYGDPEAMSEDDELAELELHDINDPWLWDEIDSLPEEDEPGESESAFENDSAGQDWEAFDRTFEGAEGRSFAEYVERPLSPEPDEKVAPAAVLEEHQWLPVESSYSGEPARDASEAAAQYGITDFQDDRVVARDPVEQRAMPIAAGKTMLKQLIKANPHFGPEMLRKTLEEQSDAPLSVSKSTIYRWLKDENLNTKEQRMQYAESAS